YLGLTQRAIRMPMTLVASSVAEVFKQRAGYYFARQGECREFFIKTSKTLLIISVLPFLMIITLAPALFSFLFGAEWRTAGEFTRLMGIMFFFQFTVSPVSSMFVIAEKQKYDLWIQSGLFVGTVLALSAGYYLYGSAKTAILLFSLVYSLKYGFEFLMAYRFSKGTVITPDNFLSR
ncbi:lipopolysaccharide biosynthesis protein, partial [Thermodesulfobacteriota bacterium]